VGREGMRSVWESARGQQRHRLGGEPWRKMVADAGDIASKTATRGKMRGIGVEPFVDGDRPAALDGAARQFPRRILRLPERLNTLTVRFLEVVRDAGQVLDPVAALAVGDAHHPRVAVLAAPVGQCNAGRDGGEAVRLLLHRQLEAGGAVFERARTGAAGHVYPLAVLQLSRRRGWTMLDLMLDEDRHIFSGIKGLPDAVGLKWT